MSIIRTAAGVLAIGTVCLGPALAQPAAPDPKTTIPEKIAPSAPPADDLSEKLDRSGGIIPPPNDPGPGIEVGPPAMAPSMPVIPPPGTPENNPNVQPK